MVKKRKKKLWFDLTNPYIANMWGMIKPHYEQMLVAGQNCIICIFMAVVHLLDVVAQSCFIIGRLLGAMVESVFQLIMIYGKRVARPIVPTWEEFKSSINYIVNKAPYKEPRRGKAKKK